ncbi:glycerate kinase-like isoform X2 [Penaeus japonicus]|uniref:glycerate kinase-like isoform X2 n=1 Tax=Penaeus japonicus TaxID=27405 RepID=UPI001C7157F6|nr:glycerate kinase-like isoform X2 [Penaeus japonicus]
MASKYLKGNIQESISRIRKAFMAGVDSVQPHELIEKHLQRNNESLEINKGKYSLTNNVYVVGFGKAVIGMVRPVEEALKNSDGTSHVKEGVISVPIGIQDTFAKKLHLLPSEDSVIEIVEGAKNNIPDEAAYAAARKILSLVQRLKKDDLLLVLISGGGSALLPYPTPPLTLNEKSELVKSLSKKGATITELNTVRKALSLTKGGKLASATEAQVVTLILSDIIGSPLDMIASGPTVCNTDPVDAAENILKKHGIIITENLKHVLDRNAFDKREANPNVSNCIIGSNETALSGVLSSITKTENKDCQSIILSSSLSGEAGNIGSKMAGFASNILEILCGNKDLQISESDLCDLCINEGKTSLIDALGSCRKNKTPIWLIFGGETTVQVKGSGRGGRNQEMVLAFSMSFEKLQGTCTGEVVFLSGGTDGIDGPTDAAGAVTYWSSFNSGVKSQLKEAKEQGLNPDDFLNNNDSYTYFSQLSSGQYLLQPGHTGTNVMDLQILFINPFN